MRENKIICGAMPEATKLFPDGYFNCCISSPPYWALRDYGVDGQLGLEPTFEEYIEKLCDIYDEVKRVLRDDGTCWVNLGDTYNAGRSGGWAGGKHGMSKPENSPNQSGVNARNVPTKSLCGIPERFVIEMVNRGWILRNTIIWHKPNPMPSSAKDRFTVDFEYVYFFVKSNKPTYYINPRKMRSSDKQKYDYIWIHRNTGLEVDYQPFSDRLCKGKKRLWNRRNLWEGRDYWFEPQYEPVMESTLQRDKYTRILAQDGPQAVRHNHETPSNPLGRNKRTMWDMSKEDWDEYCNEIWRRYEKQKEMQANACWTIPTQAYPGAHFATFPEKLVEPMIKAGCPEFVCTKCGKAREKIGDTDYIIDDSNPKATKKYPANGTPDGKTHYGSMDFAHGYSQHHFKGYTDCGCGADWRPGRILDCFCRKLHHRQGSRQAA